MDITAIVTIASGIIGLIVVFVSAARYFAQTQKQVENLKQEVLNLQKQSEIRQASLALYPEDASGSKSVFEKLLEVSSEAEKAVSAEIHSVSIPVPSSAPTDLRIILSTDPEASKVVGREFPITTGIAGWVYTNQEPYIKNHFVEDPKHFAGVDKAADTKLSEGATLSIPIITGTHCLGVMQFFKSYSTFQEQDIAIAKRYLPAISRLLLELEQSPQLDVPSIARGNIRAASVLFSDIRSFSGVMAKVRLEVSAMLLNEYYNRMTSFALTNGGKLLEYIGDGLYLSFSLDTPTSSARAAVKTAVEMQKEYDNILRSWQLYQHPVSEINKHKIGIASGLVYTGMMGHPRERREKLVGSPVNLAAHLCENTVEIPSGILISQHTADLIASSEFKVVSINTSLGKAFQVKLEL